MIITPFPKKPWFLWVCSTCLLKTLWEKEKLLVTSNFSFSHSLFCLLTPYQATIFFYQTKFKGFADDNLTVAKIMISVFDRRHNIVGKGKNAGYQQFSPFPTMFSKDFFPRVIKSLDRVVKS